MSKALKELKVLLAQYGFAHALNGETGYHYLRCRDCSGDNASDNQHELIYTNVKHKPDCRLAAALSSEEEMQ